ncbi:hypothetical protein KM043_000359 [Ampulex compressa]|nr:hypothetical protein KM043_000359 [Ampulex compressa]
MPRIVLSLNPLSGHRARISAPKRENYVRRIFASAMRGVLGRARVAAPKRGEKSEGRRRKVGSVVNSLCAKRVVRGARGAGYLCDAPGKGGGVAKCALRPCVALSVQYGV